MVNIAFFCTGGGAFLKFVYQNLHILKSIKSRNSIISVGGGVNLFLVCDRNCGAYRDFKNKIPTFLLEYDKVGGETFEIKAKEFLDKNCVDVLFLTCDRIVRYALLDSYCKDKKAFNLHPALLPKYIGMYAIKRCFKSSDGVYGATIHYVTQEVDLGPRVARMVLQRDFKDSLETFTHRLFVNQSIFFLDFVAKIVSGISFEILSDEITLGIAPFPLFICKKDIVFFNAQDSLYLQI